MMIVILIPVAVLAVFFGFVMSRNGKFHYERSGLINAPAEKVFPYISDLKQGTLWNPYEQKDPQMKRKYSGQDAQVGSIVEFEGNRQAGSGKIEILKIIPNQLVEMRLTMTSPFRAENLVRYRLTPEGAQTRFSWGMEGNGGFMGKLVTLIIDCEKMMTVEFDKGISNLKAVAEKS
jgi:uncharacterized protein YndB with AHSA1/START domain